MREVKAAFIPGFQNRYIIHENGHIYAYFKQPGRITKCRRLKAHNNGRYLEVQLHLNGKMKHKLIHRLLAEAFVPNPNNKPQVNHIDGNKLNNSLCNLEWCTSSENNKHAFETGLSVPTRGSARHNSKLTEEEVREIRGLRGAVSQSNIAKRYGINQQQVCRIQRGKRWGWLDPEYVPQPANFAEMNKRTRCEATGRFLPNMVEGE